MSFLRIAGLAKSFGEHAVLTDIDLAVAEGEVLALLGPSGSGKTTLLRLLAGFERPDDGQILVDAEDVAGIQPARRGFGMVFQHYALFPHMTVAENVAFGLHDWGLPADRIADRVAEVLELVDLDSFEDRAVTRISGGQQQRVALARAVAPKPRLLLLDEPLSNLDPDLRERTRRRLRTMLGTIGITTILVTHEQDEAFDLGDRVAVLGDGFLQQVDRPETLYRRPVNRFVAGFIGRVSLIPGSVGEAATVAVGYDESGAEVWWRGDPAVADLTPDLAPGEPVELAVRPENLALVEEASGTLGGTVVETRFLGPVDLISVETDAGSRLEVASERSTEVGERVRVTQRGDVFLPRIFRVETGASG